MYTFIYVYIYIYIYTCISIYAGTHLSTMSSRHKHGSDCSLVDIIGDSPSNLHALGEAAAALDDSSGLLLA